MSEIEKKLSKLGKKKVIKSGGIRRKAKVVNSIKPTRLSNEEKQLVNLYDKINRFVKEDTKYQDLIKVYIDNWFVDIISNLRKKDFKEKTLNLETLNEDEDFKSNFFSISSFENNIFKSNYKDLNNIFSKKGYNYYINQLDRLLSDLEKEDYIPKEKPLENIENIGVYYEKLGLEKGEIPTLDELKKKFLKLSSKYHPDKHPDELEKYTKLFQEIDEAYNIVKRYHYKSDKDHLYK